MFYDSETNCLHILHVVLLSFKNMDKQTVADPECAKNQGPPLDPPLKNFYVLTVATSHLSRIS